MKFHAAIPTPHMRSLVARSQRRWVDGGRAASRQTLALVRLLAEKCPERRAQPCFF